VLHHARVGVDRRERGDVVVAPAAQQQALAGELGRCAGWRQAARCAFSLTGSVFSWLMNGDSTNTGAPSSSTSG
jgi:hypothetical protein